MAVKKKKPGRMSVDDFDATPPGDGNMGINSSREPQQNTPFTKSQKGLKKYLTSYQTFLVNSFRNTPRQQQEAYVSHFSQIVCIGIGVVILQVFYSVLIPQVRIISLPIVVGGAWFIANKLVAPAILKRLAPLLNRP